MSGLTYEQFFRLPEAELLRLEAEVGLVGDPQDPVGSDARLFEELKRRGYLAPFTAALFTPERAYYYQQTIKDPKLSPEERIRELRRIVGHDEILDPTRLTLRDFLLEHPLETDQPRALRERWTALQGMATRGKLSDDTMALIREPRVKEIFQMNRKQLKEETKKSEIPYHYLPEETDDQRRLHLIVDLVWDDEGKHYRFRDLVNLPTTNLQYWSERLGTNADLLEVIEAFLSSEENPSENFWRPFYLARPTQELLEGLREEMEVFARVLDLTPEEVAELNQINHHRADTTKLDLITQIFGWDGNPEYYELPDNSQEYRHLLMAYYELKEQQKADAQERADLRSLVERLTRRVEQLEKRR